MALLHLIEFAVIVTAGRLVYVHFRPDRTCRRCKGRGCRRCHGSGVVFRLGARWAARAHLALLRAISEWRN
jgi:hypothetical protein